MSAEIAPIRAVRAQGYMADTKQTLAVYDTTRRDGTSGTKSQREASLFGMAKSPALRSNRPTTKMLFLLELCSVFC